MNIIVVNRDTAESKRFKVPDKHVVISISCVNDPAQLPVRETCKDILRLEFHDFDAAIPGIDEEEFHLFSKKHAQEILDFFEKHYKKVPCLLVHCDAGLSRSPGVAAALTCIMGESDKHIFKRYHPNRRVYRMLLEEHHNRKEKRSKA